MTRIDAHHHVWRLSRADYGWLTPERGPIYRDFGLADLMPHLAAAAIDGTILVQAAPTEAETAFMLDVAKGAELVRGVVGWIDLDAASRREHLEVVRGIDGNRRPVNAHRERVTDRAVSVERAVCGHVDGACGHRTQRPIATHDIALVASEG